MTAAATPSSALGREVHPLAEPLGWGLTPEQLFLTWPDDRPLACLWSGATVRGRSRWSVFAEPAETLADGRVAPPAPAEAPPPSPDDAEVPPFLGGWIGALGYDLGRVIEPAASGAAPPPDDRGWPLSVWHRCPAAYAHDAETGRWWSVGEPAARRALPFGVGRAPAPRAPARFRLGPADPHLGRDRYRSIVARALEYIRDGHVYQVNLAHRLTWPFGGSPRALMSALMARAGAWYGGYMEVPAPGGEVRAIASASPELFLALEPGSRRVVTRPMKGTRPASADPSELRDAAKDTAELNMIIDLMRNDLGRIARIGSVRVEEARAIEPHGAGGVVASGPARAGGVWQAVGTVSAVLRDGVSLAELLAATFPAGSVTGAPKIRAMQIIDELEDFRRGPYCGSVGFVSDCGRAAFSVAIRTACISSGVLDYPVGAGIVADSRPDDEWIETLHKARAIIALAQGGAA
ncbi:MAG: anthranilate synthase component I family protein [Phycisphaerales bacterium]|nr:anthranilate synthase component I family protein [Phycisphaerales bacterium]